MKCRECGQRYSAADGQPAPGGSSAPGILLIFALLLYAVAGLLFWNLQVLWAWLVFGLACFVMLQVAIAWHDCRRPAGLSPTSGEICPRCGTANRIFPWSL